MSQVLYIGLGAILALLGGFLTQTYQNHVIRVREDRELLFKALDLLFDLESMLNGLPAARSDIEEPCKKLFFNARRIQTRHYRRLAERLIEFALKDVKHTIDDLHELRDQTVAEISKPCHAYHSKEKEFFKKVAKEFRRMRGGE